MESYCRDDFSQFVEDGALSELVTCFSRDPETEVGAPRHVQDNIWLRKERLVRLLLEEDSVFYVCGDAKNMAKQGKDHYVPCCLNRTHINLIRLLFSDGHGDHVYR